MKKLFYLTGSVCFLAVTLLIGFHLGQRTAEAQGSGEIVGFTNAVGAVAVVTSGGDVYRADIGAGGLEHIGYSGNIFGGAPVNVESSTWGRIKHDHKDGGQ